MIGRAKIRTEAGVISHEATSGASLIKSLSRRFALDLIRPSTSGWRVIQEEYPGALTGVLV